MDVVALSRALVDIPSPTGSEGPLADFLVRILSRPPFRVREQALDGERRNIWADGGTTPQVILSTHMDTVPGAAASVEDEEFIYGRGACDAKGSMAAMIAAAGRLAVAGVTGVGLLFVAGEETDSVGARQANKQAPGSQAIIVGEPTDNRLGLGHKGTLFARLQARGKRAHSAIPHLGQSAIEKLLDILNDVRHADFGEDPLLGKTLVNIGIVEGGIAVNVVPDAASAVLAIRPALSVSDSLARLTDIVAGRAEIEIQTTSEPQKLWTLDGLETAVFPFGTDVPHLSAFGKPLLYGPGSARWAHAEGERIEKSQLLAAVKGYEMLVRRILAGEPLRQLSAGRVSDREKA